MGQLIKLSFLNVCFKEAKFSCGHCDKARKGNIVGLDFSFS